MLTFDQVFIDYAMNTWYNRIRKKKQYVGLYDNG